MALANMGSGTHTPQHFLDIFPAITDAAANQPDVVMTQGPLGITTPDADVSMGTNPTPAQTAPRPGTENLAPSAGA
eukprot:642717-Heterocapsa_arctica.AAC.1